ncbi:MAG TPA: FlgO family outer membrane protein [Rhodanobacter sp.]
MRAEDPFLLGPFEVWPDQNRITGPDGEQRIEPKAMAVLLALVAAGERTVPREELIQAVWPRGFVSDDALNGCVAQLRRALDDDAHAPRFIATIPKVGYRLVHRCTPSVPRAPASSDQAAEPVLPAEAVPPPDDAVAVRRLWPRIAIVVGVVSVTLALVVGLASRWRGDQSAAGVAATAPVVEKSIAVLPFANLSEEHSNAFFARGMQEEILSELARVADLKVISRTSVMGYQGGSGRSMREIAKTLGVAYVIEGSVQRVGKRVRVTAQLIDARRDVHLWADHYDRDVTDVFAIQSEIARNIADHLRARILPREQVAVRRALTTDLGAYELYDAARNIFVWNDPRGAGGSLERQVELLEQAIKRDPGFALAYCALAKAQDELSGVSQRRAHLDAARRAIDTALRLQPDLGEAHRELGRYYYYNDELDRGYDELLTVARNWPNDAETFRLLGEIDRRKNRWEEAIAHLRRASELDPRNGEYTHHLQLTYRLMHRYDEGLRFIADAFARDPQYPAWKWLYLAEYKLDQGDPAGARKALAQLPMDFSPTAEIWVARFHTALYLRDYDEASRIVAATPGKWASFIFNGTPPQSWANGVLARLRGDRQKALEIFANVRATIEAGHPRDPRGPRYLDLAEAAQVDAELGRQAKAINEATEAVSLVPRSSADHQRMVGNLARVYALTGEQDRAIEQLDTIVRIPAGPSYGDLRFNPIWDSLRGNSRFEQLVADIGKKGVAIRVRDNFRQRSGLGMRSTWGSHRSSELSLTSVSFRYADCSLSNTAKVSCR